MLITCNFEAEKEEEERRGGRREERGGRREEGGGRRESHTDWMANSDL